jgi:hypothetical protein
MVRTLSGGQPRRLAPSPPQRVVAWLALLELAAGISACKRTHHDPTWGLGATKTTVASVFNLPASGPRSGEFEVVVPAGVEPEQLVVVARDSLQVGENVTLLEPRSAGAPPAFSIVAATGPVVIGSRARLGSVYSYGTTAPLLENGAVVQRYVKTAARWNGARALIGLGVLDHAAPAIDVFRWQVAASPSGEGDRTSRANDSKRLELTPGTYGAIVVGPGSTTRFQTGQYFINTLELSAQGILEIDNSSGPVYVWVQSRLDLGGLILDYSLHANILFGYTGTSEPSITAPFRGTLVAPNAAVTVPATSVPHSGAFFARSVRVSDGATIEHRGFVGLQASLWSPDVLCTECAASGRAAIDDCCKQVGRQASIAGRDRVACNALCISPDARLAMRCENRCDQPYQRSMRDAYGSLDQCMRDASLTYTGCQIYHAYRPDTCSNLGHAPPAARASCE